ncbi:potassium transporter Kup [Sphingomonas sp. AAP5]|uniref:potassium transporter Kup n=1 Tax=unclassified Sphingomonas TaxID=196159 RepID=UPI0010573A88|nr:MULTISPECIES: potassium transporter Kup [unclassified Sphingomonas]MDY7523469.1 potassium transporter Kup [Sphingomonas sp. 10B4]MEB0281167.1 potassium transporter Kup [Sphingomonas sp. 10B4]QBM77465.1 potassium transporter Kup [Sphingomonas sp. AAP5]
MTSATDSIVAKATPHPALVALTIGAIGVVFGDIGTSPLYAFREALNLTAKDGLDPGEILGVLSLAIWSLILVVTVKYVIFLMRADNQGEGGVLALTALARRALGKRSLIALVLGAAGASLFYGDAIITPALSVLSAVEGLKTIPGLGDVFSDSVILGVTIVILVALFFIQSRGTASVSALFGPVCIVWFLAIGALGLWHITDEPSILRVISPHYGAIFLATHGVTGLFVLGAVFLTVTGAEALTADMGHFGVLPIRIGWFVLVFPCLILNYLGQGAYALSALEAAAAAGKPFVNQDWFFLMAPEGLRPWLIGLAMMATVIASQAVITGAYSLTQQAIQLGLLPRLRIRQTSATQAGQIYLPSINWLLLVGVLVLVIQFRTSSAMAAAYGIAVTGTMVVTTLLAYIVVRHRWNWGRPLALAVILPFLTLDLIFFGANILRVIEGGWVPLVVAAVIGLVIYTWNRGRGIVRAFELRQSVPLADLAAALAKRPPERVEGTAVFLTANPDSAPGALLHNLKHNKVLHEKNLICSIRTADRPSVEQDERAEIRPVDANFTIIVLTYGFMESPDVPRDLGLEAVSHKKSLNPAKTSYFIGRNTIKPAADQGMPLWQDRIFMFLQRNASDPTDFLKIPPGKVLELGEQVTV